MNNNTFEWTEQTPLSPSNLNEMQNIINNNITEKIKNVGKIIWTNPDPSINFSAQTILLDESLDDYDMYEILVLQTTTNSRIMSTGRIPVGHGTIISYNTSSYLYRPTEAIVSSNTVYFEDAKGVAGTTVTVQNEAIIPMYIIGYNTGIFE